MKPVFVIASALLACFLFSSCATIINGSRQPVIIRSVPPGAMISINDSVYGTTPRTMHMKRNRSDRHLKLTMSGYEPYEIDMERSVDGWIVGNILFGGIIGIGIDALTGAMYHITPGDVSATLKPLNPSTAH